jgi:ATP-dependent DNA helicase RecG
VAEVLNARPVAPADAAPLRAAMAWLAEHPAAPDDDLAALTTATSWDLGQVTRAWRLATGRYRGRLEDAGWDVDLLPPPTTSALAPPAPPAAGATGPAEDGTVRIQPGHGDSVALHLPDGHPLREQARTLPGAAWDGQQQSWQIPITRRAALALRAALTGHQVLVHAQAAAALRAAADSTPSPDVRLVKHRIEIRAEHTPALQDALKRTAAATWDGPAGCWHTSPARAHETVQVAAAHDLLVEPAVQALADARFAPFDYDGTIDGLRGVPVSELHAVAAQPARGKTASLADRLTEMGLGDVYSLLSHVPYRYIDRRTSKKIRDLAVGEKVSFIARVTRVGQYDRQKRLIRLTVNDGSAEVSITFFNAAWVAYRYRAGDEVVIFGRLDVWEGGGRRALQMTNPIMDPSGDDTAMIVPVYPQSEKSQVTTWDLHSAAMEAVRRLGDLQDPLPTEILARQSLMGRVEAYRQVHAPETLDTASQARERLAFDELFRMQLALGMRRYATAAETGVAHQPTGALTGPFMDGLPFPLTGAQTRALAEIRQDLLRPHPMHRLLQGDVGSGKSICAFLTLLTGIESGYQGALMAPTEILAQQLAFEAIDRLGHLKHPDGRDLQVRFLGGRTRAKEKREILAALADGSLDLIVGTHALLSEGVEWKNLGIVVVDEQHRFGVEQRAALRDKGSGNAPDMLIMTATPIPRTSSLVHYGDLSIVILDELPPGRTPIETCWTQEDPALDVLTDPAWDLVRREVENGRQAYIVASLVEDNEKIAAESCEAAYEGLQGGALNGLRLGLVHGKQDRAEREKTMLAFKNHELDVLVATTVIEVGVNVPNATVMVVLNAPRFGIAQLHQVRGRVGRGQHKSYCILTGKAGSADGVQRMQALVDSTDGFHLSEVDLQLRGTGTIFGSRQSGQTDLRVADLTTDKDLLVVCRNEADTLLDNDPALKRRPQLRAEVHSALGEGAAEWLSKS